MKKWGSYVPFVLLWLLTAGYFVVCAVVMPGDWRITAAMLLCALVVTGVFAALGQYVRREQVRLQRQQAAAEFGPRADYEHQELMRGNIGVGVYGRYQPPSV